MSRLEDQRSHLKLPTTRLLPITSDEFWKIGFRWQGSGVDMVVGGSWLELKLEGGADLGRWSGKEVISGRIKP